MQRIIVTGANGAGKSRLAQRLHEIRPDVPLVSLDALKLTKDWQQKPFDQVTEVLSDALNGDRWILDCGPKFLPHAMPRADALVWLDPPEILRMWRLACRPWKHLGQARPELPDGNVDWPLEQYRFAWRSLRKGPVTRRVIQDAIDDAGDMHVRRCRDQRDLDAAISEWRGD